MFSVNCILQALGGHCSTERDELRPTLASSGDGNELANSSHRSLSMDPKNIRRREKKKELKKLKKQLKAGAQQRAEEAALESEAAADDSDTDTGGMQFPTGSEDTVDTGGILQIKLAHWRKRGSVVAVPFHSRVDVWLLTTVVCPCAL